MVEQIASLVGIGVIAKTLTDILVQVRGHIRAPLALLLPLYLLELGLVAILVSASPVAVLPLAILFRVAHLVARRVLTAINHSFLELLLLVILYSLWDRPAVLTAVLQVTLVSVWAYSVLQKLYHGEFSDGAFFYALMLRWPWVVRLAPMVFVRRCAPPRIEGYATAVDPCCLRAARRLSYAVLAGELVVPMVSLAFSGSATAVAAMTLLALPVGLITRELSFMATNLLVAPLFLIPFDARALLQVATSPVVVTILVWLVVWPPVHAVLARSFGFSSWRLFGWGMYATQLPSVLLIDGRGEIAELRASKGEGEASLGAALIVGFGACRIGMLRAFAWRAFFRANKRVPMAGVVLRWYRVCGDRVTSRYAVCPSGASDVVFFDVEDEPSEREFTHFVRSLSPVAA
jgi:hypothetical protein